MARAKKKAAKEGETFDVGVIIRLEVSGTFTIRAADQDAAEIEVQKLIDEGKIAVGNYDVKDVEGLDITWDTADETAEIEYVNET